MALFAAFATPHLAPAAFLIVAPIGGFLGCQIDSVLGETLENRGRLTKGSTNFFGMLSAVAIAGSSPPRLWDVAVTTRRPASASVVLLSGGMDSATCLAIATRRGPVDALTVLYGQRHAREVESARALAARDRARRHVVVDLPVAPLLPSALTRRSARIPVGRDRPR